MNYVTGCYREKKNNTFTVNEPRNDRLKSQLISCKEKILLNLKSGSRLKQAARLWSLQNRMLLTTG